MATIQLLQGPLLIGCRGPAVRLIQERLGIEADGVFGIFTAAAVQGFQTAKHLNADGIVGQKTAEALRFAYQIDRPPWGPVTPGPFPRVEPRDARTGGARNAGAVAQLLEAVVQAILAFSRKVATTLRQLGAIAMQPVAFIESMTAQAVAAIRGQAAVISKFIGQAVAQIEPRVAATIRAAFNTIAQMLFQVAGFLLKLPGLTRVAAFIQTMAAKVQAAGSRVIDWAAGWLRGLEGSVENFAARVLAMLLETVKGLAESL